MEHHKPVKTLPACPKCGNEKDLIVIPGQGVKFYYCPKCHEEKKENTAKN